MRIDEITLKLKNYYEIQFEKKNNFCKNLKKNINKYIKLISNQI